MKKNTISLIAVLLAAASIAQAGETEVPNFMVGGSGLWGTHLQLTNVSNASADVTVTFWDSNGNRLVNQNISSGQWTDGSGQYTVTLATRNSHTIYLSTAYFNNFTFGSAKVEVTPATGDDSRVFLIGDIYMFNGNHVTYGYPLNGAKPF